MTSNALTFTEILTRAVADMTMHGFDDVARLHDWLRRLRISAMVSAPKDHEIDTSVSRAMRAAFDRAIKPRALDLRQRGIRRFGIEQIKPALRAELDRRIMASANLIKLNRDQAIEKTLQRFSGWATSIPAGGSLVVDKRETKAEIGKPVSRTSFEVRRVQIDQGHKLIAAVNDVIAIQTGAIAAIWRSHGRHDKHYDARPDHLARDGKVYAIRDSWAMQRGLMRKGEGYTDEITQPAEEPFCLPGESLIQFADGVECAYRRIYDGELSVITTSSGKQIKATPNHPILSSKGWIAADRLNPGDYVIELEQERCDRVVSEADKDRSDPSIAQIFNLLGNAGTLQRVAGGRDQFHGDGGNEHVDIVRADRPLSFSQNATFGEGGDHFALAKPHRGGSAAGSLDALGERGAAPLTGDMCGLDVGQTLLGGALGDAASVGFRLIPQDDATLLDSASDEKPRDAELLGQGVDASAGFIEADEFTPVDGFPVPPSWMRLVSNTAFIQAGDADLAAVGDLSHLEALGAKFSRVVKNESVHFHGHVYNLQTRDGWYVANGIVTHNCRCWYVYLHNLRELPADMLTERGRFALAETRIAA